MHKRNPVLASIVTVITLAFSGCTSGPEISDCRVGEDQYACLVPGVVVDSDINKLYTSRTWVPHTKLGFDTVKLGKQAEIPVNNAYGKLIGPSQEGAMISLAAKIWMIDNAEHTIDLAYYIFTRDLAGYAILGSLCNAVKRGVDVRIIVDSIGSYHPTHTELKGLETCADEAGFMRNEAGEITTRRARVQVVVFNALSKVFVRFNRRSHDKLIVKDGHFPEKAYVMTGGRNVSVAYHGIKDDGTDDPGAYKDVEILLRSNSKQDNIDDSLGVISELYHTLLFLHKGNLRLWPYDDRDSVGEIDSLYPVYLSQQRLALDRLEELHNLRAFQRKYAVMDEYMNADFNPVKVRLAHELGNLSSIRVVTERDQNLTLNPNSIVGLLEKIGEEAGDEIKYVRLVSPYFFIARYYDEEGNVTFDGAKQLFEWLDEDPERIIELVTNSILTSDNFMTQAIIDIDTIPRMLLTPELKHAWQKNLESGELNSEITQSEEWKRLINNPRIRIYQTGRLDDVMFDGGSVYYGKLHAKYITTNIVSFVGTTNLDYRSRLYNNEMGFFIVGDELEEELEMMFEELKQQSYLWGSPEWLELRKQLRAMDTSKGRWARRQHSIFTNLRLWGLKYQF